MFCKYCGKENNDGAKFCTGCGKSLQGSEEHVPVQENMFQQMGSGQTEVKNGMKVNKVTSIITIVAGALALLIGIMDIDYDWGIISFVCGAGFLVVGILSILKKSTKLISIIEIVFGAITLLVGFACNMNFDWGYIGILIGAALLVVGILELLKKSAVAVSIIKIVFGGILLLFISEYDWGITSLAAGAQFLANGIIFLIYLKRH